MIFTSKNPEPVAEFYKEPPVIREPYQLDNSGVSKPFHEHERFGKLIAGYSPEPKNSYARELMEKYPLSNE